MINELLNDHKINEVEVFNLLSSMADNGSDYSDLYFQHSIAESWVLDEGIVKDGSYNITHGVGARCIDVELWSSLDAANGIDSDEVKLLRVDRRGGTPIQLLSTPETSGANGSFAKKSVSTKILSLVISIVALVACVLLLAKEIYKFINEERKSGSIDNSISSMFMSGSSVENIQEKEGGSIDGMFMPGSSAEENQEPGLDTIDRYDIEGRTVSIPVG